MVQAQVHNDVAVVLPRAGMHLMLHHRSGSHVRRVAAESGLELALLSSYRLRPGNGDGLFLRFGALPPDAIGEGAHRLIAAAHASAE